MPEMISKMCAASCLIVIAALCVNSFSPALPPRQLIPQTYSMKQLTILHTHTRTHTTYPSLTRLRLSSSDEDGHQPNEATVFLTESLLSTHPHLRWSGNNTWDHTHVDVGVIDKMWNGQRNPIVTLGTSGFKDTHASTLKEYINAHNCVKVKMSSDKIDTAQLALAVTKHPELAAIDVQVLRVRNRVVLFASTKTLAAA